MCLAVPGKILEIQADDSIFRTGRVSFGGIVREINLAYTPEAGVGDYVIVHAGFAISTVDEGEAAKVFEYLDEMDELAELEAGGTDSGREADSASGPKPPEADR